MGWVILQTNKQQTQTNNYDLLYGNSKLYGGV
jgi:hypothetical protein